MPPFLKRLQAGDVPTQRDAHQLIELLYQYVNAARREYAPRDVTTLAQPLPIDFERAVTMINPADAVRMRQVAPREGVSIVRTVRRDQVIAALVSKAAATKDAIITLCRSGHYTDAYTLTRTLLENVIVVCWLLPQDRELEKQRIDTYIMHHEAYRVRYSQVMGDDGSEAGQDAGYAVTNRTRQLSAEVFDDKWMYWAWMPDTRPGKKKLVRLREMAEDVGLGDLYTRDYFLLSAHAHSAPASVIPEATSAAHEAGAFTISVEAFRGETAAWAQPLAVGLSNILMLHLLDVIDRRYALGMAELISGARAVLWAATSKKAAPRADT